MTNGHHVIEERKIYISKTLSLYKNKIKPNLLFSALGSTLLEKLQAVCGLHRGTPKLA